MVLGSSSDVLGEGEVSEYLGDFYNDEGPDNDHADLMAATGGIMENPRFTSLFASPRGWRMLRLPGARGAERRGLLNFLSQVIPFWKGDTIRDSPFAAMVPARMWNDYINNMTATDDAVELAAPHSQAEELSLMLFCEEWANDPGHTAFRRRLMNHPTVEVSDAVMKGNLIYSLATGDLRLRSVPSNAPNKLPYRLMLDILASIPFKDYSYYELNNVHMDEGMQIYTDFLSRYTPLTATEVAMVEEMKAGVTGAGRGFASMTTNVNGDPVEAYALMQHTVEAYEVGDTMSVRANINTLQSPPYNYRSAAAQVNITGPAGGSFISPSEVAYLKFKDGDGPLTGDNHPSNKKAGGKMHVMLRTYITNDGQRKNWDGNMDSLKNLGGYFVQMSPNGLFVQQVWENITSGKPLWRPVNENNYATTLSGFINSIATGRERGDSRDRNRDSRAGSGGGGPNRGGRRIRGARSNPGVKQNFGGPKFTFDGPGKGITAIMDVKATEKSKLTMYALVFGAATKTAAWLKKAHEKGDVFMEMVIDGTITFDESKNVEKAFKKKKVGEMFNALEAVGYKLQPQMSAIAGAFFSNKGTLMTGKEMTAMYDAGAKKLDKLLGIRGNPSYSSRAPSFNTVFDNPKGRFGAETTLGRGKYLYIQILPETRVEFKGKAKTGKGKRADSKQKKGGTRVTDPTGFGKVLPGSIGKGYYIKTGMHKRTGTEEPWLIALPREHFRAFTDSTKGGQKGMRTIKPFKASESVKTAWKKFTKHYGHPVFAGTKGNPNFFRIHRDHKGTYYDKLRAKPTKKE